jgi:hypothetical protein
MALTARPFTSRSSLANRAANSPANKEDNSSFTLSVCRTAATLDSTVAGRRNRWYRPLPIRELCSRRAAFDAESIPDWIPVLGKILVIVRSPTSVRNWVRHHGGFVLSPIAAMTTRNEYKSWAVPDSRFIIFRPSKDTFRLFLRDFDPCSSHLAAQTNTSAMVGHSEDIRRTSSADFNCNLLLRQRLDHQRE